MARFRASDSSYIDSRSSRMQTSETRRSARPSQAAARTCPFDHAVDESIASASARRPLGGENQSVLFAPMIRGAERCRRRSVARPSSTEDANVASSSMTRRSHHSASSFLRDGVAVDRRDDGLGQDHPGRPIGRHRRASPIRLTGADRAQVRPAQNVLLRREYRDLASSFSSKERNASARRPRPLVTAFRTSGD